jgi:hypothetical protein
MSFFRQSGWPQKGNSQGANILFWGRTDYNAGLDRISHKGRGNPKFKGWRGV